MLDDANSITFYWFQSDYPRIHLLGYGLMINEDVF